MRILFIANAYKKEEGWERQPDGFIASTSRDDLNTHIRRDVRWNDGSNVKHFYDEIVAAKVDDDLYDELKKRMVQGVNITWVPKHVADTMDIYC